MSDLPPRARRRLFPRRRADPDSSGPPRAGRDGLWRLSPITWRLLTLNVLALAIPVFGLLFLGQYQDSLVRSEIAALRTQGEIFTGALAEGAIGAVPVAGGSAARGGAVRAAPDERLVLLPELARPMLRRLVQPTRARARLFAADGGLIADSRQLEGPGGAVEIEPLPPVETRGFLSGVILDALDAATRLLPLSLQPAPYRENRVQRAEDYPEVQSALAGDAANAVRAAPQNGLVISVAVPVQRLKQVHGALMLTTGSAEIERAVRDVRLAIVKIFAVALAVTVLLTVYLAGTIARPIRRLAAAADGVRRHYGRAAEIPDFSARRDEIGELSSALRDMTDALWRRLEAVERFAADVAHEIKNPLTSLASAVETAARIKDPEKVQRLMEIIQDDVRRLDRLISDISDASRLDAELARARAEPVDLAAMLATVVEIYQNAGADGIRLALDGHGDQKAVVRGLPDRLVQVFRNIIANAISFSPPGGTVRLTIGREDGMVLASVEDEGPGLPDGAETRIFERFYSERPEGEVYGTHSGLGLSISRQIVEALGGTIMAENRLAPDGQVLGARFIVRLPAAG